MSIKSLLCDSNPPSVQDFPDRWPTARVMQISTQPPPAQETPTARVSSEWIYRTRSNSTNKEKKENKKVRQFQSVQHDSSSVHKDVLLQRLQKKILHKKAHFLDTFIQAINDNNEKKVFSLAAEGQAMESFGPRDLLVFYFHYVTFLSKNNYPAAALNSAKIFLELEKTSDFSKEIMSMSDYQKIKIAFLTQYVKLISNHDLDMAQKIAMETISSFASEYSDPYKGELYFYLSWIAAQKEEYKTAIDFLVQGAGFANNTDIRAKFILQKAILLNKISAPPKDILTLCKAGLERPAIRELIKNQLLHEQQTALYNADGTAAVETIKQNMPIIRGTDAGAFVCLLTSKNCYSKNEFYDAIMLLNLHCFLQYTNEETALKLWLYKCCAHYQLALHANTPEIKNKHFEAAANSFSYLMDNYSHIYQKMQIEVSKELPGGLAILTNLYNSSRSTVTQTTPATVQIIPSVEKEYSSENETSSRSSVTHTAPATIQVFLTGKGEFSELDDKDETSSVEKSEQPLIRKRKHSDSENTNSG